MMSGRGKVRRYTTHLHMIITGLSFSFWMSATSPITFSREAAGGGLVVVQPLKWYRTTSIGGLANCIETVRGADTYVSNTSSIV